MTAFRDDIIKRIFVRALMEPHQIGAMGGIADECIQAADVLARRACKEWGHDFRVFAPTEIGAATVAVAELGRLPSHEACARCGEKRTK